MGQHIVCGKCGTEVYTTGERMPKHRVPRTEDTDDPPYCTNQRKSLGSESVIGFDSDPWVYQGGAWEMGKKS